MKRKARVLAVVPLAMMALGLVAGRAGAQGVSPDVTITKDCDATSGNVGDTVNVTITVTNNGPGDVKNLKIWDDLDGTSESSPISETDNVPAGGPNSVVTEDTSFTIPADAAGTTLTNTGFAEYEPSPESKETVTISDTCDVAVAAAAGGATTTTTGTQASTGFSPLPYAAAALLLLGLGGSFMVVSRRRTI